MFEKLKALKMLFRRFIPLKNELGFCGNNSIIEYPVWFESKKTVFIEENVIIRALAHFINSPSERITIKKYTVLAPNCTIVTNNHISTVGIPQCLLVNSHVNDKTSNIIIEEDVWVGTNTTILAGVNLGRGCIVGAGAIVTKPVPPYAVVSGIPAKITAVRFNIEQILEHEYKLYSKQERLSKEYLESLFQNYFVGKRVIGNSLVIDDDIKKRISETKKRRKFIEPY